MSRMKKKQLTQLVALYFAGSLALGGVAYAADGIEEAVVDGRPAVALNGQEITIKDGNWQDKLVIGGSIGKNCETDVKITFAQDAAVGSVIGGGYVENDAGNAAAHVRNVQITMRGGAFKSTRADEGENASGAGIFGGGVASTKRDGGANCSTVDQTTIDISGGSFVVPEMEDSSYNIYGGGFAGSSEVQGELVAGLTADDTATVQVAQATVRITGGQFNWNGEADSEEECVELIAGGLAQGKQTMSTVKNASITIENAMIGSVCAGGEAYGEGRSEVERSTVTIGQGAWIGSLEGGGSTGGGQAYVGEVSLRVEDGARVFFVRGGGDADGGGAGSEVQRVAIAIDGGVIGGMPDSFAVVGGGVAWGNVDEKNVSSVETVSIAMRGGTVDGNIYGGGIAGRDEETTEEAPTGEALTWVAESSVSGSQIVLSGGAVHGDVYAGGWAQGEQALATLQSAHVTISGGTIDGTVYAGGNAEAGGSATVEAAVITLDVDNAAIKMDGSGADTSILHLTDKVKTYDGKNFASFDELRVDGTATIAGGFNDKNANGIALKGSGTVIANVGLDTGALTVSNGTLQAKEIKLGTGSLTIDGAGNLQTNSGQVFTAATTDSEGKLTTDSVGVKNGFTFSDGTLTLDDAKYTLDYMQNAGEDAGNTVICFTGDLVKADGTKISELTVAEAAGGALAKDVRVKAAGSDLAIGGTGTDTDGKNLSAAQLQLADAAANNIAIANDRQLVLAGTANGAQPLVTNASGQQPQNLNLNIQGALKIGDAGLSGTLTAKHTTLDVNGVLTIVSGSVMQSETLTGDSGATITVGDSSSAGTLQVEEAKLNGAALFLDPVWQDNNRIDQARKRVLKSSPLVSMEP